MRNLSNSIRRAWIEPDATFFERMRRTRFWERHGLEVPRSNPGTRFAGRIAELYLSPGRICLYLTFLVLGVLHFRATGARANGDSDHLIYFLATALAATALLHSWHLADLDRFAVSFDWIPLLGIAIVLGRMLERRRTTLDLLSARTDLGMVLGRSERNGRESAGAPQIH